MSDAKAPRPGEVPLPFDPADADGDARIVFIGRAETPWPTRDDCPKNMRQARERGRPAAIVVDPPYRPGLRDIKAGDAIWVLTWMDEAARNLIVQAPRHRDDTFGVFALRSPARPNPLGLSRAVVTAIDAASGRVALDALDCRDGTAIVDIKPWIDTVDAPPAAAV